MSFAFNFGSSIGGEQAASTVQRTLPPASEVKVKEHNPAAATADDLDPIHLAPGLALLKGRVSGPNAARLLNNERVQDSDLVEGEYEGGFKLWECAIDLCNYLIQHLKLDPETMLSARPTAAPLQGKKVLELGCGHGLPGILCMLAGAEVHFQDFNREVLEHLTIPNVIANLAQLPGGRPKPTARFFAGDWMRVGELLTQQGLGGAYDLILTSETIYNLDSLQRMVECMKQVVQPPHGIVLVAAKTYYFGVGGGIKAFKSAVKRDGIFEIKRVYRTAADVSAVLAGRPPVQAEEVTSAAQPSSIATGVTAVQGAGTEGSTGETGSGSSAAAGGSTQGSQAGVLKQAAAPRNGPAAAAAAAGSGQAAADGQGGNVREILELSFPLSIQPYFL